MIEIGLETNAQWLDMQWMCICANKTHATKVKRNKMFAWWLLIWDTHTHTKNEKKTITKAIVAGLWIYLIFERSVWLSATKIQLQPIEHTNISHIILHCIELIVVLWYSATIACIQLQLIAKFVAIGAKSDTKTLSINNRTTDESRYCAAYFFSLPNLLSSR